jgi:hypothetical protein
MTSIAMRSFSEGFAADYWGPELQQSWHLGRSLGLSLPRPYQAT